MNDNTSIQTVRLIQEIGPDTDWGTSKTRQLIAGILELKNENEAKRFLRDLMTPLEIKEFANRLEAARLLSRDMQYKGIIERTGLSSTTIARIAKCASRINGDDGAQSPAAKVAHGEPGKIFEDHLPIALRVKKYIFKFIEHFYSEHHYRHLLSSRHNHPK